MRAGSKQAEDGRGLTRRQTLGAAGVAGAGLFLAGAGGKLAGLGGGDDEAVAEAAKTCLRLMPEQEEGAVLRRPRQGPREHRRRSGGSAAGSAGQGDRPRTLRAGPERRRRHLAVQRLGRLQRRGIRGHGRPDLPARRDLPYDASTVARVPNSQDRIYTQQGGKRSMPMLGGDVESGITAKIALGLDPDTTPAGVGM